MVVVAVAFALWYLRDPSWLIGQTTGLRGWERSADGRVWRWSGGHASFFVPADAGEIRLPVSTTFDPREPGGDRPMIVMITVDDKRAGRVMLNDSGWQDVTVALPSPGSRKVRRIDVRTNLTRADNHGVRIGQPCCFSPR
jgi:hypothetical protein